MARKPSRSLAAVVMAGGKGKRLKSGLPKVLHDVCGRPVLRYVLEAAAGTRPDRLIVVISHNGDQVREAIRSWDLKVPVKFVEQGEPLGTGHAVMVAERTIGRIDDVLVLPGDNPLITPEMLRDLLRLHRRHTPAATMLTSELPDATGYGRVIRDGDRFERIAESRDATPEELEVREVATSFYVFRREDLFRALPAVDRDNSQREYYLPDVLGILAEKGEDVRALAADFGGALDVNSRGALARVGAVMRRRINEAVMASGVTLIDPEQTYIEPDVRVGRDTVIHPQTHLQGRTRIGERCTIGPSTRIVDSRIDDGAEVTFSVVKEAKVGPEASVGPHAHLRHGTVLGPRTKAGSFVEIKNSRIGEGSKVPHLSYIGDATIGKNVNVGAGTITCNFDGKRKHRTVIGDNAFIGSDTMLVAPVRIGRGAYTGAGSTITKNVPAGALAVERAEVRVTKGYAERKKGKSGGGSR